MNTDWLRGCATALITPFKKDGSIDEDRFKQFVEWQITKGMKMLVPCGTTGETATTSEDEDNRIIKLTIDQNKGRAKIIAGTGSNSTKSAMEYSVRARDGGADAVLVVAPYYNKPTQAGMYAHFRAVAEAVPTLPVVLYNVPGRTSCNLLPATTLKLANDLPNVVAVKEASGDLSQIMQIIRNRPAGFKVLSGDDAVTFPLMALGGDGVISVASNEIPDLMTKLCDLCLKADWNAARDLHFKLLPLMETNFIESSPGPVKAVLAMMGIIEENFRLPLVPVQDASRAKLKEVISELGLLK